MQEFGVDAMFTLNGGHIWPLYEAARNQGVRVVDTRHEQSATFAAEAYAKLTRRPGVAALTAGPGITNGVSAVTSAWFNGVAARRARRAGAAAPMGCRLAAGARPRADPAVDHQAVGHRHRRGQGGDDGPRGHRHRRRRRTAGRCSSTSRSTCSARRRARSRRRRPGACPRRRARPRRRRPPRRAASPAPSGRRSSSAATCTGPARGTQLAAAVEHLRVPVFTNGLGRGTLPADHELAFLRTRGVLKQRADVVVVLGTPLDFRLGFGRFGSADGRPRRRRRVAAGGARRRARRSPATSPPRSRGLAEHAGAADHESWIAELRAAEEAARAAEAPLLAAGDGPIKPTRVYGELRQRLARDAVVICDGGDFASYAGKYVEVFEPGCWLDTGPYGCLGNGLGYSIAARVARPDAQIVAAARRRRRRVQPDGRRLARAPRAAGRDGRRQQRDVGAGEAPDAGDLRLGRGVRPAAGLPLRRGRAGARRRRARLVTEPDEIGPALDRAFAAGVPYLVNVVTDPADVYPRSSNLG